MRIAIFVSGRGSNMRALLRAHRRGRLVAQPVVVFSNRRDAPALTVARRFGIPTVSLSHRDYADRSTFDAAVVEALRPYACDGAVLAGYMRIVTPLLLEAFPAGVINIHPSLLPAFPGIDAVRQAWDYGVKTVGCTVHFVDAQVDHGPIIAQSAMRVAPATDADDLARRLLRVEHRTLVAAVRAWAEGRLTVQGRHVHVRPADV